MNDPRVSRLEIGRGNPFPLRKARRYHENSILIRSGRGHGISLAHFEHQVGFSERPVRGPGFCRRCILRIAGCTAGQCPGGESILFVVAQDPRSTKRAAHRRRRMPGGHDAPLRDLRDIRRPLPRLLEGDQREKARPGQGDGIPGSVSARWAARLDETWEPHRPERAWSPVERRPDHPDEDQHDSADRASRPVHGCALFVRKLPRSDAPASSSHSIIARFIPAGFTEAAFCRNSGERQGACVRRDR